METTTRIRSIDEQRNGIVVETPNNQYAFPWLFGDKVRGGKKADIEGLVTYGGESLSKNYIKSYDFDEVPEAVIEAVGERATVVDGVGGGWDNWDGRPEWSNTYIDISEAEVVESPAGGDHD